MPSTRISVLNMLPFLERAGIDARIVYEPDQPSERPDLGDLGERLLRQSLDIVYFQKVHGPSVIDTVRVLRSAGTLTVHGVCDHVAVAMAEETSATVVVTEFLKSLYPPELQHKIHVVHDGIEHPERYRTEASRGSGTRALPLRAVLVTSHELERIPVWGEPPGWLEVVIVGRYPWVGSAMGTARTLRRRLLADCRIAGKLPYVKFLLNSRIKLKHWTPEGVYQELERADIGIIPVNHEASGWKLKSENRLTLKMACGLPVVATPIPSYEPIVRNGENAFLADSASQWWSALEALRSEDERRRIGTNARAFVLDRFSMEEQARKLVTALRSVAGV